MKKNFLYSVMALCMCLFAACSQEEIIEGTNQSGKTVSLSVSVPGGATTRALPTEKDHKLRCIMQVVDGSNKAITGEGMRQVAEVTAEKITFTFKAPEGDYKCLFWADFVTDVNTDNLYKTSDLTNITYNKTDNALFSTAADAFCGYVADGTTTIQLKRPFAKVSVTPNNATDFNDFNKLTVSYNAPSGFNMVTKAVGSSAAQKVTYTKTAFNATSGAWFSSYIFAPANVDKLASAITMQLSGTTESKTLTIEAGKVPLSENFEINGKFDAAEGSGNVNVDVSFGNEFDKPEVKAPVVGDYFYADGTWGTATSNANGSAAVGVVFHIESADAPKDAAANYTGVTFADSKVRGWVVAANSINGKVFLVKDAAANLPAGLGSTATDVLGFANTNLWNAGNTSTETYSAIKAALDYNTTVPVVTTTNMNSGWYLPAAGQMTELVAVYAENNSNVQGAALIIKNKLQALADVAKGELMGDGYHWTSTGVMSNEAVAAFRVGFHSTGNYAKNGANTGLSSGSNVRPVLTF